MGDARHYLLFLPVREDETRNSSGENDMCKLMSLAALLLILVLTALSFAAEATGTWKGTSKEGPWVFKLNSAAGKLTGNTYSAEGKELVLKNGKIEGDNISFAFDSEWQGQTVSLLAKGSIKGDAMTLHIEADNGYWGTDVDLKRSGN